MATFADVPEQREAKRLLEAALADGPAHAYLFHGPAGVGKRVAAQALAGELLGDPRRVDARTHPDLQVIEALGEMIRIDEIRALHHDLHMRPFEGDRRVYLVFDAHRMNDDAAASLLKDLEEPPAYATLVLVADELGPLPETIRSRCQLVPFRRLSRGAVETWLAARAPELSAEELRLLARVAGGRLDRAARLLDDDARARRAALLDAARADLPRRGVRPRRGRRDRRRRGGRRSARRRATASAGCSKGSSCPPARPSSACGARASAPSATSSSRRSTTSAAGTATSSSSQAGAETAVANADRLDELTEDAPLAGDGAAEAAEAVRETWRIAEEFNVSAPLALEALFVRLRRAFSRAAVPAER